LRKVSGDVRKYEQLVPGSGWKNMWCAIGTGFSEQDCDCTIRVSSGKSCY